MNFQRNNKILTIAIPVYNVERYLKRALSSVILQEYENNIEIIVINDGSSDTSQDIINQYANKYPKLINSIHKNNGGWGSCIKLAIKKARGKYFKVLDSDDWFDSTSFETFIHLLKKTDSDLILTPYIEIDDAGNKKLFSFPKKLFNKTWSISQHIRNMNFKNAIFPLASITYRTSILLNENITIGDKYYSDIDYDLQPLIFVKTIHILPCNLYRYYRGREGQSTSKEGYIAHMDDYKNLITRELQFFTKRQKSINRYLKKHIFHCILSQCSFFYKLCMLNPCDSTQKKLSDLDDYIKRTNPIIYLKLNFMRIQKFIPFIFLWRYLKINIYNF